MRASMHNVEHVEVEFDELNVEELNKIVQTVRIIVTDKDGYEHTIDLFMTDSGTLNIKQK